jgi:hypothetical protein
MIKLQRLLPIWDALPEKYINATHPNIRIFDVWPGFGFTSIDWRLPSEVTKDSIKKIEELYKNESYFNCTEENFEASQRIATEMGYTLSETMHFTIWNKPIVTNDLDYQLEVSSIDGPTFEDYEKVTMETFNLKDNSITQLNKEKTVEFGFKNKVITLKTNDGDLIGTGGFVFHNNIAWLFSGCIREKYRNQGYWKSILRERQLLAQKMGATTYFLQTVNPYIKNNYDESFKFYTFRKDVL